MKNGIHTYARPFLMPALICCSILSSISPGAAWAQALDKQAESETEVLAEPAVSGAGVLMELAGSAADVLVEQAGSGKEPALEEEDIAQFLSASPEDRRLLKELLRLRIRHGEDFTFAMKLPEDPSSGFSPSAASDTSAGLRPSVLSALSDCRILPGCPLPKQAKTIQALENRLTALTETYSGNWSVYAKNLTTEESFVIEDVPMKSASVMKLFILGTVYEAIGNQELDHSSEITDLMTNMICDSSNEASNRLLSLLGDGSYSDGIAQVNSYISRHGYSSLTHEYNGFDNSDTICDPDHFNQVSAIDCGKFLERVYHRELASRRICNEIESLMLNQHTRYKIPAGLPEGAEVGNKTGEMDTVENDVAIIYGDYSDYILCVLSNDWNSKNEAISHIQEISSTVYDFFNDASYYQDLSDDSFTQLARLFEAERYGTWEAEDGSQYVIVSGASEDGPQYVVVSGDPEDGPQYVVVSGDPEDGPQYVVVSDGTGNGSGSVTAPEGASNGSGHVIVSGNTEYVVLPDESESESGESEHAVLSGGSLETELSSEEASLSMDQAFPLLKRSGSGNAG